MNSGRNWRVSQNIRNIDCKKSKSEYEKKNIRNIREYKNIREY